jgi:hypothetical protein
MNFLCRDMEQLHDITLFVDRICQDVTRSPGGDSQIFHTTCAGCHTGMDPMTGAFAYFDWDATQMRVVHTPGQVRPKYRQNANVFPYGYIDRQPLGQLLARRRTTGVARAGSGGFDPRRWAKRSRQPRVLDLPSREGPASLLPYAGSADSDESSASPTSLKPTATRWRVFEVAACMGAE